MDFTERGRLEQGFSKVFHDRVKPELTALESDRIVRLGKARKWTLIPLGVGVVLAALIFFGTGMSAEPAVVAVIVLVLGVIGALVGRNIQHRAWSGSVAETIMPAICDHVGDLHYDRNARDGFPVGALRDLGMIGRYDNKRFSDRLWGRYRDTDFEVVEARLTRTVKDSDNKSKTETVFDGLLFRIGVPVDVPTPILIARDHGKIFNTLGSWTSRGKGRGMPKVELDHEAFEAAFEVHAENPEDARRFLPPAFLDNLLTIAESEGGKKGADAMTAGFEGRSFYLALSRKGDFLAMGSLSTPVTEMEDDLHSVFDDLDLVHRIIDRLHGDAPG